MNKDLRTLSIWVNVSHSLKRGLHNAPCQIRTERSSPPETMPPDGRTERLYTKEVCPESEYTRSPPSVHTRISLTKMLSRWSRYRVLIKDTCRLSRRQNLDLGSMLILGQHPRVLWMLRLAYVDSRAWSSCPRILRSGLNMGLGSSEKKRTS